MFRLFEFLTGKNVSLQRFTIIVTYDNRYYFVTNRALRKRINRFNHCGVDGLIVKKRPGRMAIINDQQACELADLIDQPRQAARTFWTTKAFHVHIRFI